MRDRKVIPYTYSEKIYVYDLNGLDMSDITYESDMYKVTLTRTCIRIFTHIRKYYKILCKRTLNVLIIFFTTKLLAGNEIYHLYLN